MLQIQGTVLNTFRTKRGERDGEKFGGDDKVQLLVYQDMADGTRKQSLVDLKVPDQKVFADRINEEVVIPVGAFAPAKNSVIFYMVGEPRFLP